MPSLNVLKQYMVPVEVIYIPATSPAFHKRLSVSSGSSVKDVLIKSGIYEVHPETLSYSIGVFSRTVSLDRIVCPQDRIEIYRPLLTSPEEKRKQRVKKKR